MLTDKPWPRKTRKVIISAALPPEAARPASRSRL